MISNNIYEKYKWNAKRFGVTADKWSSRVFKPVETRAICNSIPKSGTHLLERIICLHPYLYRKFLPTLHHDNIDKYGGINKIIQGTLGGQLLFSHFYFTDDVANALRSSNIKTIFMMRDPRDIIVSEMHFVMRNKNHWEHSAYAKRSTKRDRLLLGICGTQSSEFPSVRSLADRLKAFSGWLTSDALVVRFEDLIGEIGGGNRERQRNTVAQIFDHLGAPCSNDQLGAICETAVDPVSPTFRKGVIGGWRQEFDSEVKKAFKNTAANQLVQYGYEENDDW